MSKTLCEWKRKDIETQIEKLIKIVSEPNFLCKKCARSTSDKKFVCKPIKIKK